jgi:hypothetical protein
MIHFNLNVDFSTLVAGDGVKINLVHVRNGT